MLDEDILDTAIKLSLVGFLVMLGFALLVSALAAL